MKTQQDRKEKNKNKSQNKKQDRSGAYQKLQRKVSS